MAESVWDYPRPPRVEPVGMPVRIELGGRVVAASANALRVLETSHPPTIYVPFADFAAGALHDAGGRSLCEWKGAARYHDLVSGTVVRERAAWSYPEPTPRFAALRDHACVYPSAADACFIDDERVTAQEGDFYGGWITRGLEGPFKGGPGTWGW